MNKKSDLEDSHSLNMDHATVASFGHEWSHFDQSELSEVELKETFDRYFMVFPWHRLPANAEGFDMGCGSGRWAKFVASRVGTLNCIDASDRALVVARRNLADAQNVQFMHASVDAVPLAPESQDFGYSLGVLHHIPDTEAALRSCVHLLKPGAPFLVYLYYRFDNRPAWFRAVWRASEILRAIISKMPPRLKNVFTDLIALFIYWPLSKLAKIVEISGINAKNIPLYFYRNSSFYVLRTDSRDRFGTPLEKRFTLPEIKTMLENAGLIDITASNDSPFWCVVGFRKN